MSFKVCQIEILSGIDRKNLNYFGNSLLEYSVKTVVYQGMVVLICNPGTPEVGEGRLKFKTSMGNSRTLSDINQLMELMGWFSG